MTESQAREEICRVGRSLYQRGYAHATAGNISVRLDDGFLITPTDACLGFLDPATLSTRESVAGSRKPRQASVGVIRKPSSSRTLMLPAVACA